MLVTRSVMIRLVAVSLLVAACSIAATAWLTTASTRAQFSGDQQRTLDADNQIYNTLVDYSRAHPSWDGVQAVIDSFGSQTDRIITLTATDGSVIASSDANARRVPTGAVPTAVVDPLAASIALPPRSVVTKADAASEPAPVEPAREAETAPAAGDLPAVDSDLSIVPIVPLADTSLPPTAFALTPLETALRTKAISDAQICAEQYDVEVHRADGVYGGFVLASGTAPNIAEDPGLTKIAIVCSPELADAPGARYVEINAEMATAAVRCLTANGVTQVRTGEDDSGLRTVTAFTDGSDSTLAICRADAVRAGLADFVAPAAQLYLSSPPVSASWLSTAGGARILLTLVVVLIITILAAALGARRLLRPIRSLTRAAQRMAAGETQARVIVRGSDEVARLGVAFNAMAESLQTNERQRQHLISDIAHELRTPLANVRGYLEGAQDDLVRLDDDLVVSLLDETLQLQHLIDDLQDLALADAGQLRVHPEPTDVCGLVERAVGAHRSAADTAGITMRFAGDGPTTLSIDPVRIRQAVGNLLTNAIRYTPRGGTIDVSMRTSTTRRRLVIEVADTGVGISRDDLPHLFDRFFRADSSRSRSTGGSGLGLAVTRHLVEAHLGTIEVRSAVGRGTHFSILLPLDDVADLGVVPKIRSA